MLKRVLPVAGLVGLAACVLASGCAVLQESPGAGNCVPRMSISSDEVIQGDAVSLVTADVCKVEPPPGGWRVSAGHVGDGTALISAETDEAFDGSFDVSLELPDDFPTGEAWIEIEDWDYSTCADTGSCAGPSTTFAVLAASPPAASR